MTLLDIKGGSEEERGGGGERGLTEEAQQRFSLFYVCADI
jgi:hypothetical protein